MSGYYINPQEYCYGMWQCPNNQSSPMRPDLSVSPQQQDSNRQMHGGYYTNTGMEYYGQTSEGVMGNMYGNVNPWVMGCPYQNVNPQLSGRPYQNVNPQAPACPYQNISLQLSGCPYQNVNPQLSGYSYQDVNPQLSGYSYQDVNPQLSGCPYQNVNPRLSGCPYQNITPQAAGDEQYGYDNLYPKTDYKFDKGKKENYTEGLMNPQYNEYGYINPDENTCSPWDNNQMFGNMGTNPLPE